jgi:hypothetical protein
MPPPARPSAGTVTPSFRRYVLPCPRSHVDNSSAFACNHNTCPDVIFKYFIVTQVIMELSFLDVLLVESITVWAVYLNPATYNVWLTFVDCSIQMGCDGRATINSHMLLPPDRRQPGMLLFRTVPACRACHPSGLRHAHHRDASSPVPQATSRRLLIFLHTPHRLITRSIPPCTTFTLSCN